MSIPVFRQLSQIKYFHYDAKLMLVSSMIMSISQGYMWVDFPIYLKDVGYNPFIIGILLSINVFVGSILMFLFAIASDRLGRKKFIILGRVFLIGSILIYLSTYQFYWMVISALLSGIAFASVPSSYTALLTEKTDSKNRNLVFATNSFFSGIFMAIGMMIGALPPFIMQYYKYSLFDSYRVIFFVSLICAISSFMLLLKVTESYKGTRKTEIVPKKSIKFIMKLSILGLIGLGAGILVRLFPLWFNLQYHLNVDVLGPIFAISQVAVAFAAFTTPEIAKRLGEIKTIVVTQALSIFILIIMPSMPYYFLAGILFVLRNVFMNMSGPLMNAFQMNMIPSDERAKGAAIIQTFDAVPRSMGPSIGGYLFNLGMYSTPFYITGVLYAISVALFFKIFRSVKTFKYQSS